MRKLVVFLFAVFLTLQGAVSMARDNHGPCCDGCQDLVACASTSCPACTSQVADSAGSGLPWLAPGAPAFPAPQAGAGRISFDIWKPPWW